MGIFYSHIPIVQVFLSGKRLKNGPYSPGNVSEKRSFGGRCVILPLAAERVTTAAEIVRGQCWNTDFGCKDACQSGVTGEDSAAGLPDELDGP